MKIGFLTLASFLAFSSALHAQNVGIGVSLPLEKLHVAGTIRADNLTGTGSRSLYVDVNGTLTTAPGTAAAQLPAGTTAERPASPVNGHIRYNSTAGKFEFYENGTWTTYAALSLNSGQILVGNSSNIPTAMTPSGDVTISNTGVTTIENNSVDGTDIALGGDANGDIMYYNGTDWVSLPAGTAGRKLQTNGAGAPSWVTAPSGSGTFNYLARWTPDGATLGTGATYDNGSAVGIGTTTMTGILNVQAPATGSGIGLYVGGGGDMVLNTGGTLFFDGNYSYASGNYIRPTSANSQSFVTAGTERLRINSAGVVRVTNLAGTNNRVVTTNASGDLSGTGTVNVDSDLGFIALSQKYTDATNSTSSDYYVNTKRYYCETAPMPNTHRGTFSLNMTILNAYCGDDDGCEVMLGMRSWDGNGFTASRGPYRLYINGQKWRFTWGDNQGTDNDGTVTHVAEWWDCYFTDGTYTAGGAGTDNTIGFFLLDWNDEYANNAKTCFISVED